MQAMHAAHTDATDDATIAASCKAVQKRGPGRPRGSTRTRPSVLLRSLAEALIADLHEVPADTLERVWFKGFCAGATTAAPDRVRHCARCDEPFIAGHLREIYCGARCRNTMVKRRYRARLRARRDGPRAGEP